MLAIMLDRSRTFSKIKDTIKKNKVIEVVVIPIFYLIRMMKGLLLSCFTYEDMRFKNYDRK